MFDFRNSKIKSLAKEIIEDFTYFVRDEVHKGRTEYLETGINDSLDRYEEFFLDILSIALGLEDRNPEIDKVAKSELVSLIKRDLSYRRYIKLAKGNRVLIYKTCEVVFDKVVEGILGGDLLENR